MVLGDQWFLCTIFRVPQGIEHMDSTFGVHSSGAIANDHCVGCHPPFVGRQLPSASHQATSVGCRPLSINCQTTVLRPMKNKCDTRSTTETHMSRPFGAATSMDQLGSR